MDNTELINEYIKLLVTEINSLTTANVTLKAKFNVIERELQNTQIQLQQFQTPIVQNSIATENVNSENSTEIKGAIDTSLSTLKSRIKKEPESSWSQ